MKKLSPTAYLFPIVMVAAVLTGCSAGAGDATGATEPLLVLEWTGYQMTEFPQFFQPFTDKYGDNLDQVIEYSFFGDDAEALTKMQTGFEADLVHPCNSWWQLYVNAGLLQPIDTSRLEYWDGIPDELKQLGQFNGEQYIVPWDWGYDSLLVRADLVPEMPDSWADLWDPQYARHIAIWDSAEQGYVITALALGLDPWNTTPEEDEMIKQKLLDLKPNVLTYWLDFTEVYNLSSSGDAWIVANAWQDAYGYLLDEGYDVEYLDPAEGRLSWVCGYGINANSTNLDLAYEFLNAAIAPESMAALGNEYLYGFSNFDAIPLVDENVAKLLNFTDLDTFFANTVFYQPLTEEKRQAMSDIWTEVKAAQ